MQKSKFAERNLSSQTVSQNAKQYNWPYSQPRLVNAVHATSRIGLLLGAISGLLVMNDIYSEMNILAIDLFCVISFILLRGIIIPMIRRANIKEIASESRKFNKIALILSCIFIYAGMTRFLIAGVLIGINNHFSPYAYYELIKYAMNTQTLIAGILIVLLPTIFLIYPKDIAIKEYHYKVKNLSKQIPDIPDNSNSNYQVQYVPEQLRMPNSASAGLNKTSYGKSSKSTYTTQRAPKKTQDKKTQNNKQNNASIWDSQKSVRKPRK